MPFRGFRLLVLVCAFAALTARAVAAPAPGSAAPREQAETFFNTIIDGDGAKAFDTLLAGSSFGANRPEASYNLRRQLQTSVTTFGKPLDFDLVEQKTFGRSLVRLVYILRLEKYPLTWEFFFYQNGRTNLPIDVRFSDKLDVYRYDRVPAASDGVVSSP